MRYCEALNCSNSSQKGFKMCHFPRSPNRRVKWIRSVGRDEWSPKKYSTLCEVIIFCELSLLILNFLGEPT